MAEISEFVTGSAQREFARVISLTVGNAVEVIEQPLWDTVLYPAGGTHQLHAFTVPYGNKKSQEETNMVLGSQLPRPQAFWIDSIALSVIGSIPYEVLQSGLFELIIGSKPYFTHAPLASLFVLPEGLLTSGRQLQPGLGIISDYNFVVNLRWMRAPKLKQDAAIRIQFNGWLFRPIR